MKMACGRAEPGSLGPSRRRWLGSARFPGSGFPLTPLSRSGLPPPTPPLPGMFLSTPAPLLRAGPWGLPQPRLPFLGAREGATRAGRLGSSPLSSQGEIPPRSPQALGSQNNPAGEGKLWREGSGRGAEPGCGVLQVPLGRGLEDERAYGERGLRHHPAPRVLTRLHPRGVPQSSRDSKGGPEASRPVCFPTGGLHHPGPDRLTPGVAAADDSAPAQQGACTPRPVSAHGAARPAPRLLTLPLCLSPDRGPVRAPWEAPGAQVGPAYPAGGHGGHPRPGQGLHRGGAAPWLHRSFR